MSAKTFIDIIVPTYNRPSDIEKFIHEIQKQNYENFKVYIIDDHGNQSIEHLIPKNNSKFYFERLLQNKGQTFARNHALTKGSGNIVVFMDDDAWFLQSNALSQIVNYFEKYNSSMGCLMFDVIEPSQKWLHERKDLQEAQEIGEFIACGCAFNRTSIETIGGFSEFLHSYGEETDITLKLIRNNKKVLFGKKIKLFHNYNPHERSDNWLKRFKHNSTRNDLLIVIMRFPLLYILPYFLGKFISHICYNFKHEKQYILTNLQTIKALYSTLLLLSTALQEREAVSVKQFKHWKTIRFQHTS